MINRITGFRASVAVILLASVSLAAPTAGAEEGSGPPQLQKKIVLAADAWCPYNCEPGFYLPGYVVEIARTIFEKNGYEVEYRIMGYEQAMADTLHGRISAVIGLDRREGEDVELQEDPSGALKFQYPASIIGRSASYLFVLKENPWRFNPENADASLAELGGRVGIVKGYACELRDKLSAANMLVEAGGKQPLRDLLAKLREGEIKAIIDDRSVMLYTAGRLGWALMLREAGLAEDQTDLNLAFCAGCKIEADIFDRGVEELRSSGGLSKILAKYELKDWAEK